MFNSLRHRNYRIYLTGQMISMIGTWVQSLATSWLVYSLTKSSFWLGATGFATLIPSFFFSIFSGVYVDHVKKLKLLKWTQSLALIQALALAILTATGHINVYIILTLNFILGTINAFDTNARQSFVVHMVTDRNDLPNAIALNSTVANGTRLIGPMLAGIAIASFGETICFVINAISFIAVLAALFMIKVDEPDETEFHISKVYEEFKIGYKATFHHPSIKYLIYFLASSSFFGMPYNNLFPAMAQYVHHDSAKALGIVTSINGIGSLVAAIILAKRRSPPDLAFYIGFGGLSLGIFTALSLIFQSYYWMLFCIFFAGMGLMFQLSASNTMVQTLAENDKRGRVISFLLLAMLGITPFGSLAFGSLSERIGLNSTLITGGLICAAGGILFLRKARHINEELILHVSRRK